MKRAALVISTFNNPRFLGMTLASLTNQTCADFEVFIADDGSGPDTKTKIDSFQGRLPSPIRHFWQENKGFRKAMIHNRVFRELKAYPVIICIDQDGIAERHFIEDHLRMHEGRSNFLFMGRRVYLGPKLTAELTEDDIPGFNHGLTWKLLRSGLVKDSHPVGRAVRIPNPFLRKLLGRDNVRDLIGSNFSISSETLYRVNGYDENFKEYWGEDGDLFIRVRNSGATIAGSKALAIQYHLDHKRPEIRAGAVEAYEAALKRTDLITCRDGIEKK